MPRMSDQTPKEPEEQPTGLAYFRKAAEVFSKKPLPSYEERAAQFKRNNEKVRAMQADEAAP